MLNADTKGLPETIRFFAVDSASRTPSAVPLLVDGPCIPFHGRGGGQMQTSDDFRHDVPTGIINAIGGEPLAGSGFAAEEPEPGFSVSESEGEE